jgi:hypothetical protein
MDVTAQELPLGGPWAVLILGPAHPVPPQSSSTTAELHPHFVAAQELPLWGVLLILAVKLLGYYIFRGANNQVRLPGRAGGRWGRACRGPRGRGIPGLGAGALRVGGLGASLCDCFPHPSSCP